MTAPFVLVMLLLYVPIFGMPIAVYRDAKHIGVRPGLLPGLLGWGPAGWAVLSLFLGVIAVPIYTWVARPRLIERIRQLDKVQPLPAGQVRGVPARGFPKLIAGMLVLLIVLVPVSQAVGRRGAEQGRQPAMGKAEYSEAYSRMVQAVEMPGAGSDDCDIFRVILCGANGCTGTMPRNCGQWSAGFAGTLLKMKGFRDGGWTNREQLCLIHRLEDRYLPADRGGNGKADLQEAINFCRSSANPW